MNYSILFICFFSISMFFLGGCEQTVNIAELPFEEKIMVEGILKADSMIEIVFSKTVPVLDTQNLYTIDTVNNRITSLQGTISIDGISYPLIHINNGRYRIFDAQQQSIKGKIGSMYMLNASWNDKIIYAQTQIPIAHKPDILSIKIDTNRSSVYGYQDYIKVFISLSYHPEDKEAIVHTINTISPFDKSFYNEIDTLNYKEFNYPQYFPPYYFTKKEIPHISAFYVWLYAPSSISIADALSMYSDSKIITKHYDKAMKEYIDTQYYGNNLGGIFGGGGTGIHWNIKGQGLGLFIGYSDNILPLPLQ
jgi:hypothetical protein